MLQFISENNSIALRDILSKTAKKSKKEYVVWLYPSKKEGYLDLTLQSPLLNDKCVVICEAFYCNCNKNEMAVYFERDISVIGIALLDFLESTKDINGKCVIKLSRDASEDVVLVICDESGHYQTSTNVTFSVSQIKTLVDDVIQNKENLIAKFNLNVKMLNKMLDEAKRKSFEIISKDPFTQHSPSYAILESDEFVLLADIVDNKAELNVTAFYIGLGNINPRIIGGEVDIVLLSNTVSIQSTGNNVDLCVSLKNLIDLARPIFGKDEIPITINHSANHKHNIVIAQKNNIYIILTTQARKSRHSYNL